MSHIQMIDDANNLFISSNNVNNTENTNAYQKAKLFPHIVLDDFFPNTDITMKQTLWLGVYPALGIKQLDFVAEKIEDFFK
jgi:dTDP-4-amino-4,6-dideoxygalactose transaminase